MERELTMLIIWLYKYVNTVVIYHPKNVEPFVAYMYIGCNALQITKFTSVKKSLNNVCRLHCQRKNFKIS